jgi:hypothetical protein
MVFGDIEDDQSSGDNDMGVMPQRVEVVVKDRREEREDGIKLGEVSISTKEEMQLTFNEKTYQQESK